VCACVYHMLTHAQCSKQKKMKNKYTKACYTLQCVCVCVSYAYAWTVFKTKKNEKKYTKACYTLQCVCVCVSYAYACTVSPVIHITRHVL
jgi:hypothetical protein